MTKQILERLAFIAISLAMLSFLLTALSKNPISVLQTIFFSILVILLLYGFIIKFSEVSKDKFDLNLTIFSIIFCTFGSILTRILILEFKLTPDLSACIIGVIGIIIETLTTRFKLDFKPAAVIYLGTFIGVTSLIVLDSYILLSITSTLGGICYILLKNSYVGVGGKLGATAFMSVLVISLIIGK